jgi:Domain of unknown function (DUF4431)
MERHRLLLILGLTLLAAAPLRGQDSTLSTGAAPCLRYEPDTVALTGTLSRRTEPGPLNYESVPAGDEPETYFYLDLARPVCTIGAADSESANGAATGVRQVQLVLKQAGYDRLRPYLRRHQVVMLRGTLFAAITGHHHAPLLLTVTGFSALPAKPKRRLRGAA